MDTSMALHRSRISPYFHSRIGWLSLLHAVTSLQWKIFAICSVVISSAIFRSRIRPFSGSMGGFDSQYFFHMVSPFLFDLDMFILRQETG